MLLAIPAMCLCFPKLYRSQVQEDLGKNGQWQESRLHQVCQGPGEIEGARADNSNDGVSLQRYLIDAYYVLRTAIALV